MTHTIKSFTATSYKKAKKQALELENYLQNLKELENVKQATLREEIVKNGYLQVAY